LGIAVSSISADPQYYTNSSRDVDDVLPENDPPECFLRYRPMEALDDIPATCDDGSISYPTPLMSDIEFADNGDMILGFTDRTGFQFGDRNWVGYYRNYGVWYVCCGRHLKSL